MRESFVVERTSLLALPTVTSTNERFDADAHHAARSDYDPAARNDPSVRRRVPPPDASTVAFDRAQQVLREVADRQQAEEAAAAHAAELESEAQQLRAELARQAAYDVDADAEADADGQVFNRAD